MEMDCSHCKTLLIDILKNQVKPALGCTEPGAVALAVAKAREVLGEPVESLSLLVDKNILKNGMDVGIPGTEERGIVFAAALALCCGNSAYGLEVLKDATDADVEQAGTLSHGKTITLQLDEEAKGLSIAVTAVGHTAKATVIIKNAHTNMVHISRNNEILLDTEAPQTNGDATPAVEIRYEILKFTVKELIAFADAVPIADIAFIQDGIDMNLRMAKAGLSENIGVGFGKMMLDRADEPLSRAKAITSAASEARMAGWPLPVMSSAGSGNHGLVAIIPIAVVGQGKGLAPERILRAVALSHLITIFVKAQIGVLSPVCGCGVAAGVGCAAGLVYLEEGTAAQVEAAIHNMAAGLSGMICDGAKIGCAYKLSIAVSAATDAAKMALMGVNIPENNGILGRTAEQTIKNMARVSADGMDHTDDVILKVMLERC